MMMTTAGARLIPRGLDSLGWMEKLKVLTAINFKTLSFYK
jgi:hypothetical protein